MKKEKNENAESGFVDIVIDSIEYQTTLTKKYATRKTFEAVNNKLLTAFIPGTITDVLVQENQEVKAGQALAILEAMKMLNEIKAPFDTKVKSVLVQQGDRVTKNQLIIELE